MNIILYVIFKCIMCMSSGHSLKLAILFKINSEAMAITKFTTLLLLLSIAQVSAYSKT